MRDSHTIDPMWEPATPPGGKALRLLSGLASGVARRAAPHLFSWARGRSPAVVLAWGSRELRVGREGLAKRHREGAGWTDNPRANFNEGWRRGQALADARSKTDAVGQERDAARAELEKLRTELEELQTATMHPDAVLDLSPEALAAGVQKKMGIDAGAELDTDVPKDPDALKARLSAMRSMLQSLDDVSDWGLMEAVDDELYELHKAVEYKLRNHRASEAKAKLDDLFKS
jgi:hypothetical protein